MEINEIIKGRRSVRKYSDKPLDDETINEIIESGLWAPSGVNLQPWYFVAVKSEEKMAELSALMNVVGDRNEAHLSVRFADHPEVVKSTVSFIKNLGNAPVVLLAFRDKPDYTNVINDEGVVQSIAAAVENILLAAYDKGISSCWLTAPSQVEMCSEIRDAFAPGHGQLVCMVTLGYAEDGAVPRAPKRKQNKFVII